MAGGCVEPARILSTVRGVASASGFLLCDDVSVGGVGAVAPSVFDEPCAGETAGAQ